jgi:hypothetical protein
MKALVVGFLTLVCVLSLGSSAACAEVSGTNDTAAILANIGVPSAMPLTEAQMEQVRGQAVPYVTKYVMVQMPLIPNPLGSAGIAALNAAATAINALDKIPGDKTANPFNYAYGYWGGLNWTNGGVSSNFFGAPTADAMDGLFMIHDKTRASNPLSADTKVLQGLLVLPKNLTVWGSTYVSNPVGAPGCTVDVSSLSAAIRLLGNGKGGIYLASQKMAYSEYARREAVGAFKLVVLGDKTGAAFKNAFVR